MASCLRSIPLWAIKLLKTTILSMTKFTSKPSNNNDLVSTLAYMKFTDPKNEEVPLLTLYNLCNLVFSNKHASIVIIPSELICEFHVRRKFVLILYICNQELTLS